MMAKTVLWGAFALCWTAALSSGTTTRNATVAALNISVTSAGFLSDPRADIFLDGTKLPVVSGRGINVAVLEADGALRAFQVFDTHLNASESEALATFLSALGVGDLVVIAVSSDASSALTPAARSAIRELGALLIDSLSFQAAYALIGIKGGQALAEDLRSRDDGVVQITGSYTPSAEQFLLNITALSAGFQDGSMAEIFVQGQRLPVSSSRGINVAVFEANGVFRTFSSFDTSGNSTESEALAIFVNALSVGDLVVAVVKSDAKANLGLSAKLALKDCGASLIDRLTFQGSYALIGTKSGPTWAEDLLPAEGGVLIVNAWYDARTKVTTKTTSSTSTGPPSTTTTTVPATCISYICPTGTVLKQEMRDVAGQSATKCCGSPTSPELVDVGVRSLSFHGPKNSGEAVFFANGYVVSSISKRGFVVVVLRPDLSLKSSVLFDIYGDKVNASKNLEEYLENDIADGELTLMAIASEAHQLSEGAKKRIKGFGAQHIDELQFHSSYALMGRKGVSRRLTGSTNGSAALAEMHRLRKQGPAVAVSQVLLEESTSDKPLCKARVANPPVAGWISNNQLELEAGCRYALWETSGASACFSGQWVVSIGSSNTILLFIQLANLLLPGSIVPVRDSVSLGEFDAFDMVIENGVAIYQLAHRFDQCTHASDDSAACKQEKKDLLAKAPAYSSTAIRLTIFEELFWPNAASDLDAVVTDDLWKDASLAVVTHIVTHYIYCSVMRADYCKRLDLKGETDHAKGLDIFAADMAPVLKQLEPICAPSGRAGSRGCVVLTSSWFGWQDQRYADYQDKIRDAMSTYSSETYRLVDVSLLDQGMSGEAIGGHGSPLSFLWAWQVILGGMCSPELSSEGNFAKFEGKLCTALDVKKDPSFDQCPGYRDTACDPSSGFKWKSKSGWCKDWECAASVPCVLKPIKKKVQQLNLTGACLNSINVEFSDGAPSKNTACFRVWCLDDIGIELALMISVTMPALVLLFWGFVPEHLRTRMRVSLRTLRRAKQDEQPQTESPKASSQAPGDARFAVPAVPHGTDLASARPEVSPVVPPADAEATRDEVAKPNKRAPAGDKFPLGLARFVAAQHVVVFHLYADGHAPQIYMFGWGFTWVPWFFMLSGFVLFNAHIRRPSKDTVFQYVERRLMALYPLYALTLLPAFAIAKSLGQTPNSVVLVAQTWLLQAWNPEWPEHALGVHCWFLSAMLLHLIMFKPLSWLLDKVSSLKGTILLMLSLLVLPWLVVIVPEALQKRLWYEEHIWGANESLIDLVTLFVNYNPLSYVHVFVIGMLLAKLRTLLDAKMRESDGDTNSPSWKWQLPLEFVLPAGMFGLLLVFSIRELQPWGARITTLVAVLLPLQALVLFGLAGLPSLPLPWLAYGASYFNFLEPYAFAVYLLQGVIYSIWPKAGQMGESVMIFLIFLFSVSVMTVHLVQRPAQRWWQRHPVGRWAVPIVLTLLLVSLNQIPSDRAEAFTKLPAEVRHDRLMVDLRLQIRDVGDNFGSVVINPSIHTLGEKVIVAARRHHSESVQHVGQYNGSLVTVIEQIWHSNIVLGEANFSAAAWAAWPKTGRLPFSAKVNAWTGLRTEAGQQWRQLCVKETWIPNNQTLLRHVVTGPEDPKLFEHRGSLALAFNSLPPLGRDGCTEGMEVSQMYMASDMDVLKADQEKVGHRLRCDLSDKAEKNWIPFTYQGKLHYVYKPLPHKIVAIDPSDGSCEEPYEETTFDPLRKLQAARPDIAIRGSGQAVLVNDTSATPHLRRPHYLALLHISHPSTGEYNHFAYRFSAEPPFQVLQVSARLPLQVAEPDRGGNPFAFVSGLSLHGRTVVVSYGAGDVESRALVMRLERLDEMFNCHDDDDVESGSSNGSVANSTAATAENTTGR